MTTASRPAAVHAQETLDEALAAPSARVFVHDGCGGWVHFTVTGGRCIRCHAAPLTPYLGPRSAGLYRKPEDTP